MPPPRFWPCWNAAVSASNGTASSHADVLIKSLRQHLTRHTYSVSIELLRQGKHFWCSSPSHTYYSIHINWNKYASTYLTSLNGIFTPAVLTFPGHFLAALLIKYRIYSWQWNMPWHLTFICAILRASIPNRIPVGCTDEPGYLWKVFFRILPNFLSLSLSSPGVEYMRLNISA